MERLLSATEDIVRRGRVKGLGVSLCTQRPAALHKTVLSQIDTLIALGVTAPQDVSAISDWVSQHAEEGKARQVRDSLPALPVGQAWVWSPEWLGVTQHIHVRRRSTFDSSATPKAGSRRHTATTWAPVDVDGLRRQLESATTAGAGDPGSDSAREIARLHRELAAERTRTAQIVRVEVPVLTDEQTAALGAAVAQLRTVAESIGATVAEIERALTVLPAALASPAPEVVDVPARRKAPDPPVVTLPATPRSDDATGALAATDGKLSLAQRQILTVLAQHGQRTTNQVALLTGRSHKGGGFRNALSSLRSAGLIAGRGAITITDRGCEALGGWEELPPPGSGRIRWWAEQLDKAPRVILEYLARHPDRAVPIAEIAGATGYSPDGGGFRNALSRLRSLDLAAGRGELRIDAGLLVAQA